MSDNSTLPGTGDVYASDDIAGVKYSRVKLAVGAPGSATDLSAVAPLPIGDPMLSVARGDVTDLMSVNKFGRSTNVDSGTDTDIWDGANATLDQAIWIAPTAASIHTIVSSHADDDGSPVGDGARTIRVYGLTAWDAAEVSEDITMNGVTGVTTENSFVIIHRMKVLTKGATNTNVGIITATAAAGQGEEITAQINAGEGQTQMAIYGISSLEKAYMTSYYASAIKSAVGVSAAVSLLVNPEPDAELLNFLVKHTNGLGADATNHIQHRFAPYFGIPGPAIIKMQSNASTNDTDVSAGFDLIVHTI